LRKSVEAEKNLGGGGNPFGLHHFPRIQNATPLAVRLKVEEILAVGLKDG
jgi:hypothetical protein